MKKRVVVTGIGAVTPIGNTVADLWRAIQNGESGAGPITLFDASDFPTKFAMEVKDFDPSLWIDNKDARKMDRFSQFAAVASTQAWQDAGLDDSNRDPQRCGVIIGNGIGGIMTLEESYKVLFAKGNTRIPPMTIPKLISNEGPGNVAILLDCQGPCYSVITACSAGTDAIGSAFRWIQSGDLDVCVSGGTEAAISQMGVGGFCVLKTLSSRNDDPKKASRPFDKDRDGFVIGEGSGIIILEELEHAKKRGAKIYGEILGYGMTCDANHLTSPHPEGVGAIAAMKMALNSAGIKPADVDYINAHGTSTEINDPIETKAFKAVFGDHAKKLKISSTKSMHGHCIAAAGGIEAIISLKAIGEQYFPPTINLENPAPECDLDYVPNKGVRGKIDIVMSDSLGFGGHNGVLVFKKYTA